jgi:predicted phosphohydrolase
MHTRGKDTRIHRSASRCMIADHLAYPAQVWYHALHGMEHLRPCISPSPGPSRWTFSAVAGRTTRSASPPPGAGRVKPDDVVLLAGDTSWAMKLQDALVDLQWIAALPGRKIISRGNHDYWWSSERTNRVRRLLPPGIDILEASAIDIGEAVVCATRGWNTPETPGFQESTDRPYYERELMRLDRALAAAHHLASGKRPIIVMIHFPPFAGRRPTEFARRIAAAGASACVYGHLHPPRRLGDCDAGVGRRRLLPADRVRLPGVRTGGGTRTTPCRGVEQRFENPGQTHDLTVYYARNRCRQSVIRRLSCRRLIMFRRS